MADETGLIRTAVFNSAVQTPTDGVPLTWRVVATVGGSATPTVTASLGVSYVRLLQQSPVFLRQDGSSMPVSVLPRWLSIGRAR